MGNRKPSSSQSAPAGKIKLSPRMLLILFALLIAYLLVRPTLSEWIGVQLPGLVEDDPVAVNDPHAKEKRTAGPDERTIAKEDSPDQSRGHTANGAAASSAGKESKRLSEPVSASTDRAEATTPPTRPSPTNSPNTAAKPPPSEPAPQSSTASKPKPKLGALTDLGNKRFRSTAGLIYRQSRGEHRIDHVMRHAEDDPGRPVHGVFDGSREQILAVIDRGYLIALTHGPPDAKIEEQRDRTVMTVDLGRKIGYMGGQAGKRKGFPACRHLNLVVEGDEVVTAYPIIPR